MSQSSTSSTRRLNAAVVVLGDIGRSPRMCYHAHSLATRLNYDVTIVGYLDTLPHSVIHDNPNIKYSPLAAPPDCLSTLPEGVQLPLKFIWTFLVLLWTLLFRVSFCLDLILMQNPPALPTMIVCWLTSRFKGSKFVIDWHNYMWSVLRDKYGFDNLKFSSPIDNDSANKSLAKEATSRKKMSKEDYRFAAGPIRKKKSVGEKREKKSLRMRYVELVHQWEGWFGRRADAGLCVTSAMRDDLSRQWNVPAAVFYDRPPSWTFGHVSDVDKHELFLRLGNQPGGSVFAADTTADSTRFTIRDGDSIQLREERPLIVVSSTSWTSDEDFSILLDAVVKYNEVARLSRAEDAKNRLPSLLLVITGRGPMKEYYLEKIARLNLDNIEVLTPWLEPEDYPRMLAASDIGVSLHTSTSALDLPMKVVDMFGSGLPVLAKRFACIGELVEEGQNGRLFDTPLELSQQLLTLATGFPQHCHALKTMAEYVRDVGLPSWEDNWEAHAQSILAPDRDLHFERIMASDLLPEELEH